MTDLICHLTNRSILQVGGDDRRNFLQGLISNDIHLCQPGKPIYAALLTPQGKFLHDMFVIDAGDIFLIDCEAARADDLLQRLSRYKLRAKVMLENIGGQFDVWAHWIQEPNSQLSFPRKRESSTSDSEHISLRPADARHWIPGHAGDDNLVLLDPRLPELGIRIILKKGEKPAGAITDFSAYDKHRLKLGVPDGSRDMIVEKSTLLEGNFDLLNGISWTKGCYMGQELTARMHYRALVKKRMFPVGIDGAAPSPGTPIQMNEEEIGEMRSSCDDVGLALLNVEKAHISLSESLLLTCAESRVHIIKSPLL